MKEFNTAAVCIPEKHYMVDLSERVEEIKKLVDAGKYFTINRARQYGKTTTLLALSKILHTEYEVISLDFQGISSASFSTEKSFCRSFIRLLLNESEYGLLDIPKEIEDQMSDFASVQDDKANLEDLMNLLWKWCRESAKPIVLLIDEVDSATNHQVFFDFLAQLRSGYISRDINGIKTFQSVIFAGVTDVKNCSVKFSPENAHKVNSPWNIAADFDIDMSLSEEGIRGMLLEYEADHHTGMDTAAIAKSIREYTNGYPYLVSRICQLIDTKLVPLQFRSLSEAWTEYGVDEAVKLILSETSTLFQSVMDELEYYRDLKSCIRSILMEGTRLSYNPFREDIAQLEMYGLIRNDNGTVAVSNRIFEMRLYNHFIGESNRNNDLKQLAFSDVSLFVTEDGRLDIPGIMEHFIIEHQCVHGDETEKLIKAEGRERFLTYLVSVINGTGIYYIEAQTRNQTRTDVIVDFLGERYIIELKIWHGERYNAEGEKQISEYLNYYGLDTGYMLSFNFNQKKEQGVKRIQTGDRVLFEGTV